MPFLLAAETVIPEKLPVIREQEDGSVPEPPRLLQCAKHLAELVIQVPDVREVALPHVTPIGDLPRLLVPEVARRMRIALPFGRQRLRDPVGIDVLQVLRRRTEGAMGLHIAHMREERMIGAIRPQELPSMLGDPGGL